MRRQCLRNDETEADCAIRFRGEGWCPYPLISSPAVASVFADYKATCACGKRVSVSANGLFFKHKPSRPISAAELRRAMGRPEPRDPTPGEETKP